MILLLVKSSQILDLGLHAIVDHKALFITVALVSLITWIACMATLGTTASRKLITVQVIQVMILFGGVIFFIFTTVMLARQRSHWDSSFGVCRVLETSEKKSYCHAIYSGFTLMLIASIIGLVLHVRCFNRV